MSFVSLNTTEIIGIAASIFTSSTLIPQLVKIVRERNAAGTSYGMLLVLFVGLSFWIAYGVMKNDWIIIAANAFSQLVNVATAFMKWRFT
jgi:MtN3 and saliva related transmembrane protein